MKIVYISNAILPSRQANSIQVIKMCQAFAQNGHEIILVAPNLKDNIEPNIDNLYEFYGVASNFEIVKIPWIHVKGWHYIYNLIAAIFAKWQKPDLVYGRSMFGCYFCTFFNQKTTFEAHDSIDRLSVSSKFVFELLIKSHNFVGQVVISDQLKKYFKSLYPFLDKKTIVAHDGGDAIDINNEHIDSNDRLIVGYAGHLYPGRGMKIIKNLAQNCTWADFHIIGGNPKDILYWENEMSSLQNVVFHGFIPHAKVASFHQKSDVLIAPYQKNVKTVGGNNTVNWMSPMKIFEYMVSGKAIICSNFAALREVLTNEHSALLCESANLNAWVDALNRLRNDPQLRRRLGDNARNEFLKNYTWNIRAKRVLDFLLSTNPR
jgi:glycosyltransferase involved in cell wall biosynthesis